MRLADVAEQVAEGVVEYMRDAMTAYASVRLSWTPRTGGIAPRATAQTGRHRTSPRGENRWPSGGGHSHHEDMRLVFTPAEGDRCRVVVYRRDGVTLEMRSYDRKFRVPHDLAHAVTERELRLGAGVFGCIAAGAVFTSMQVLTGSPRHDSAARSARIIKANARSITTAEALSGVLHEAANGALTRPLFTKVREVWGIVEARTFPYDEATITATAETLKTLANVWSGLTVGEELVFMWPPALTAPIPTTHR
ncbi:hypothetical protein ACFFHJ_17450 [Planotetraspora thailandica]|uniref:hypothetical protein n=1 Tax=Planotetraspora thailandica TaxID=487172 RepID=UPI00194F83BC|nr:hypothetical protein [Planotetraspora thailandica]